MRYLSVIILLFFSLALVAQNSVTLNQKDDGFRGIWYSIGKTNNEYVHKYSGGLGTYPANHYPFSVYAPKVKKTFFCYGGASKDANPRLLHEVAYFDHQTKTVCRPTIVLNKQTGDAHDNPVMSIDKDGYIWIFSTSHGTERPSYIHKSSKPYDIESFEKIEATYLVNGQNKSFDNFSYLQIYYHEKYGFLGLMTHYDRGVLKYGQNKPRRTISYITSKNGVEWSAVYDIGIIQEGHYQSSAIKTLGDGRVKIASAFNYHPDTEKGAGLDYRTNLYYLETTDFGKTWQNSQGQTMILPLTTVQNSALVINSENEGKMLYINDLDFDRSGNPMVSYITSKGPNPGPDNGPYEFTTAYFDGTTWGFKKVTDVDHNYDYGSLYFDKNTWRIIAPMGNLPLQFNTGGEIELWELSNKSFNWKQQKTLTKSSEFNQAYPRKPINYHADFYAFWADGHARQPSASNLYFSNKQGDVFKLPYRFSEETYKVQKQ